MFLWISLNFCPLNWLLVRSHQAKIMIAKRLIQGCNNVTRVRVEPRPYDQGRLTNDAFTHSVTLPTMYNSIVNVAEMGILRQSHQLPEAMVNWIRKIFVIYSHFNAIWIAFRTFISHLKKLNFTISKLVEEPNYPPLFPFRSSPKHI